MSRVYQKIPIVDTARRCGIIIDSRTLNREEVEASCPFCHDHGPGKYHLSLNTTTDQYRCNLCGASGNSVTLYAKINNVSNKEAFQELTAGGNIYLFPRQPVSPNTTVPLRDLTERHEIYTDMLNLLTLSGVHHDSLRERGFSDGRIDVNMYRSMPATAKGRKLLAAALQSYGHDLHGMPGFYTDHGVWTTAGPSGLLIPVRNKDGLIQGLKIRLDEADKPNRKYRWFSSRNMTDGTRSYSWIHITGNTASKRAFLTEGPLKGDAASFLNGDELFVCLGGVNAIGGLKETLVELGVTEVVEAMDMDQMFNPQVRKAVQNIRQTVCSISGIKYSKYVWSPNYKGVDDYLLSCKAAV